MEIPCLTGRLTVDRVVRPNNSSQTILFVPADNTTERPPPDSSILLSLLYIPRNINRYINKLAGFAVLLKCYSNDDDNFTLLKFSFHRPRIQVVQGFVPGDMAAGT
jgi:hypothetical protein